MFDQREESFSLDRFRVPLLLLAVATLTLQGCVSRTWAARRLAGKMLDPASSPRQRLACRQRLIALAPDSDEFLPDAFFPIGLYDVPESSLQEVAAAGFNLVVNGGKDARYLRRAEAAGLRVIPYIHLERMAGDAARVADARAVMAWYLFDEPDLNRLPPEEYHRLARKLRRADRSRPIFLTVYSPAHYRDFVEACDVLAPNPYPIRHLEPERNNLRIIGMAVDAARVAAAHRPVWAIVQVFWAEPIWVRNPTPDELRAMVFLALNHGANGVIYFSFKSGDRPITEHAELFEMIARINGQLRSLRGPLLVSPRPAASEMTVIEEDREPVSGDEPSANASPPLDCSLRPFRGAHLLIAVNPDPWMKRVSLSLTEFVSVARAHELFAQEEDGPASFPAGEPVTLDFGPHEVRLFWLD